MAHLIVIVGCADDLERLALPDVDLLLADPRDLVVSGGGAQEHQGQQEAPGFHLDRKVSFFLGGGTGSDGAGVV